MFQAYVGQALWDIDAVLRKRFFDITSDMPQYVELLKPGAAKKKTTKMTAAEIKQRTLELLSR